MAYVNKGFKNLEKSSNDNIKKSTGINKRDALPQSIDWRTNGMVRPIQNQGECGSCWAFSTIDVLESYYAIANNGTFVDLSEQQLVDCVYSRDGCDGGILTIQLKFSVILIIFFNFQGIMETAWNYIINNNGINTETSYPYTSGSTALVILIY
jgi:C1A family cysteine protease